MYMVMSREPSDLLSTEGEYAPSNGSSHPFGISSASAEFNPFTNSHATVAERFVTASYDTCCYCHLNVVGPSQPQEGSRLRTLYGNARGLPVKALQTMPSSISPAPDSFLNASFCRPDWLSSSNTLDETGILRSGGISLPSACQPGIGNGVFDHNGENTTRISPANKYQSIVDDAGYWNPVPSADLDILRVGMVPLNATSAPLSRQISTANPYLHTLEVNAGTDQSPFRYPEYENATLPTLDLEGDAPDGLDYTQFDVQTCSLGSMPTPNIFSEGTTTAAPPSASAANHLSDKSSTQHSVLLPASNFHPSSLYPESYFQQLSSDSVPTQQYLPQSQLREDFRMLEYPPLPELDDSSYQELQQVDSSYPEPTDDVHHQWYTEEQARGYEMPEVQPSVPINNHMVRSTTRSETHTSATSRQVGTKSAQRDTSKDDLLVRLKSQGMSYKQIKEVGGFGEAESTLRGRYRALTKPKEARLRKPEWGDREVTFP